MFKKNIDGIPVEQPPPPDFSKFWVTDTVALSQGLKHFLLP